MQVSEMCGASVIRAYDSTAHPCGRENSISAFSNTFLILLP